MRELFNNFATQASCIHLLLALQMVLLWASMLTPCLQIQATQFSIRALSNNFATQALCHVLTVPEQTHKLYWQRQRMITQQLGKWWRQMMISQQVGCCSNDSATLTPCHLCHCLAAKISSSWTSTCISNWWWQKMAKDTDNHFTEKHNWLQTTWN